MFFKLKSYLGIDIGAGGIKLVELRQEKKRPVLFTYGYTLEKYDVHKLTPQQTMSARLFKDSQVADSLSEEGPSRLPERKLGEEKAQEYVDIIKTLCKASRAESKIAVASLPVSAIFHAIVTLPFTEKEEDLVRLLKAEVKKFIFGSIDSMSIDYQKLSENKQEKTQKVLVNAVPTDLIVFYSKIFQRAGLSLEALEPESTAVIRSLVGRDQAVSMVIDMGAERTNFFIIDQAIPVNHQSVESGGQKIDKILQNILGIEADLTEQAKFNLFDFWLSKQSSALLNRDKFIELFMPVIDPILKKIEISFELYLRQEENKNKRPEKIILTGGAAFLPYLAEHISETFKLKCYIGDPWARVVYQQGLRPELRKIGPRMSVAIGLALKNVL